MTRSQRIFGLIQKQLPGSTLCGEFLAVGKTEMFLRGFVLFNTGRKNHTDLHGVVVPLWRPRDRPIANFNRLLSHPTTGWTIVDPKNDEHSAATVLWQIAPWVDRLARIETVADFAAFFAPMRANPMPIVRIDFVIADFLMGDTEQCRSGLDDIERVLGDYYDSTISVVRPLLNTIRAKFEVDPDGLRGLFEAWRWRTSNGLASRHRVAVRKFEGRPREILPSLLRAGPGRARDAGAMPAARPQPKWTQPPPPHGGGIRNRNCRMG